MAAKYNDLDLNYDELEAIDAQSEHAQPAGSDAEIGYPVQVRFYELSKMYMNMIAWHWHPELEVLIVNHGNIVFRTNDQLVSVGPGEGIVINANVMHSVISADQDANCSMYSTVFNPSFLFGYGDVALSEKYLTPVVNSGDFKFLVLSEEDSDGARMLECINGVIANNLVRNFGYELSTKAKLCDFWITLIRTVAPDSPGKKSAGAVPLDETRAKDMISYIEAHYFEKITLDELAASVHISKSECCRCFKRALNLTPIEYLMKYRIYKAASLIKSNDPKAASFSELAYNVGFNNASYFNKVFRQYLNCTPSEYKRKLRTEPGFDPFGMIP